MKVNILLNTIQLWSLPSWRDTDARGRDLLHSTTLHFWEFILCRVLYCKHITVKMNMNLPEPSRINFCPNTPRKQQIKSTDSELKQSLPNWFMIAIGRLTATNEKYKLRLKLSLFSSFMAFPDFHEFYICLMDNVPLLQ